MANNQYVNKVEYGGNTLIDLTNDTVAAESMLSGTIAHSASGASITGTIPTKTVQNITLNNTTSNGQFLTGFLIPQGYYATDISVAIQRVLIPVPSSGSHTFTIGVPNGTTNPQTEDDWLELTFEVDSEGNTNVTDDASLPAEGVSF